MSSVENKIRQALEAFIDPLTQRSLGAQKSIKELQIRDGELRLGIELPYPAQTRLALLRAELSSIVAEEEADLKTVLDIHWKITPHAVQANIPRVPGIKNIIAVASGKGGVGKSTTAVNLALALQQEGAHVGILDADVYGPSQPTMLGIADQKPQSEDGKMMLPLIAHGLQVNSMGFLVDADQAMIWRGPMATQALRQLLNETQWNNLDYLIIDMPPGTGDIQLTLAQSVPVTGAVIVTTPQDIALLDARRGIRMFEKVNVPILGVVENMSTHVCSNCGHEEAIFGSGGGEKICHDYGIPFLGSLPLDMQIRSQTDGGKPTVVSDPHGTIAQDYRNIAYQVVAALANLEQDRRLQIKVTEVKN